MTPDVLIAALTAYSKTLDLIVAIRADMPAEDRRKEWERHFARVQWWETTMQQLFEGRQP
jgi:hypothetical protein